jgi:hypothetical protein
MTDVALRQPPTAERARTVAARSAATLHAAGLGACPLLAATTTTAGDVLLVVPSTGTLVTALRDSPLGDLPGRVGVVDRAPLPPDRPVRARLELTGWLTPAEDEAEQVLAFADSCPADVLFDVGLRATLLRLDLAEVLLEEAGVATSVEPEDYAAARPDPVSAAEERLLVAHAGPLAVLRSRILRWAGRGDDVTLLGLDRFGVRFRVTGRRSGYDLRVPFTAPVAGPEGFGEAVRALLTCSPG